VSELGRKKDLYDILKSKTELQAQSNRDWEKSDTSLGTKLEAALKEKATISGKEIKTLCEGKVDDVDDGSSDQPHNTRQDRYQTENDSLCSYIEMLRKQVLKTQEDQDRTTMNRNELEYEIQGLRTTLRKNSTTMETQRVDLGTYKISLSRLESKYNDVVAELDEANDEIM